MKKGQIALCKILSESRTSINSLQDPFRTGELYCLGGDLVQQPFRRARAKALCGRFNDVMRAIPRAAGCVNLTVITNGNSSPTSWVSVPTPLQEFLVDHSCGEVA